MASLLLAGCTGGVGFGTAGATESIVLTPSEATVEPLGSITFVATAPAGVTLGWAVQESGGGSIDLSGRYTAPDVDQGTFHVLAFEVNDPSRSGSATVHVQREPISVSVSPTTAQVQTGGTTQFTAEVSGVPAGQPAGVLWSVVEQGGGTVDGNGVYTAPATTGTFHVVATSVADPTKSAQATVTVQAAPVPISVSISPTSASVGADQSTTFTATVTGVPAGQSTAVTWSVQESNGGTVDGSGRYTAPGSPGTFHVVATSVADPSKSARATVTVQAAPVPISVSISPTSASLTTGQSTTFTATVSGVPAGQSTAVTWSVQEPGGGTVSSSGRYTAPASAGTFHVVATSVADPSKSARATVTVQAPPAQISVSISPTSTSLTTGQSTTFTATVSNVPAGQSTAVTWSVQESGGGTVSSSGRYTAPGSAGTFHVVATSVADPSKSARATVTVSQAAVISVSVAPASVATLTGGVVTFTATVSGTTGGQSTAVSWSVQESGGGTVDSSGRYTAPGTPGTFHVVATSVADPSKSGQATLTISQRPSISVSVSPGSATTGLGGSLTFTATVTGTTTGQSTAVTWSVQESGGGSVDGSGRYTAPSSTGTFHVVATSVADPSKSDQASVTVTSSALVPADRKTVWNPGLNSVGGIPSGSWPICATLSPSGGDDASAIQAALNGCGTNKVVKLNPGTFKLSRPVEIPSNVVLRGSGGPGSGANVSKLVQTGGRANVAFDPGHGGFTQITDLAADAVKDASSLTLVTARNLTVGELVMIDQLSDSLTDWGDQDQGPGSDNRGWFNRGPNSQGEPQGRPTGQMMEVASVSGTTVTFTTPFHLTFKTANKAQLVRLSSDNSGNGPVIAAIRNAGVEDLWLSGGVGGDTGANVAMAYCAYCWIRNIEADKSNGSSVAMTGTFRSVFRDSYIHETVDPNPGGGGYGLSVNWHGADNLVENNVHWNFNKVMVMRASGGGNVIAYNYMDDGWIGYAPCFVETGLNASHSTTPMYELFEGNQSYNFDGDSTHGNSVYITVFRNHLTALRRAASPLNGYSYNAGGQNLVYEDAQNRRAIGLMTSHRYYTFIGNVLGTAGQTIISVRSQGVGQNGPFVYGTGVNPAPWTRDEIPMWQLGYNPVTWVATEDQSVISTAIRDGNFDYVTNQVHWDRAQQPLPNSLYLTGKPAFFGSNPWPWVDALGSTKTYVLPARQRFDALHP